LSENSQKVKVYLDTNVLAFWAFAQANPSGTLPKRGQECKRLLSAIENGRLDVNLQTSEWALEELIQPFVDKVLWSKFPFEMYDIHEFKKMKREGLKKQDMQDLIQLLDSFKKGLDQLNVEFLPNKHNYKELHQLVLNYMISTPDATHILAALQGSSNYIVTVDTEFLDAKIKEIQVVKPGTLLAKPELRKKSIIP
jgi:predicted nucleic acid-binding protein